MKMLLISDIHGNWPALQAVLAAEPDADQILCLGDLVNYGPQPAECVAWAMQTLTSEWLIQGNHDRAVGRDEEPRASTPYQALAAATQEWSRQTLTPEMKHFLAALQPLQRFQLNEFICAACHAVPSDPLYAYLPETASVPLWESELNGIGWPDFLFLGHTHQPTKARFRRTLVVNPGSVGQPKDGNPRAAYAIWEDGEVTLRRAAYDVEETIRAYRRTGLNPQTIDTLAEVLRTGGHLPTSLNPYEQFQACFQKHPDKLAGLFYLQKLLDKRHGQEADRLNEVQRQQWLLNLCRAADQKLSELVDCAPWKWWASYQKFDRPTARQHIVDLWHCLVSLAEVMQMTPDELFEAYTKKRLLNPARQDSGYTDKDENNNKPI
ncbi:MAG TPA: metallophosphoesterase family protein [Verrucomicrobiae bacterium]|nr:metallophosphoesterase family protein [Verrucomicrobiae bacterium]